MKGVHMPAGIEQREDGSYAFASRGVPAWHNLGEVFDKDANITTADMLRLARLDGWNVRVEQVPLLPGVVDKSRSFAVMRDNGATKEVLGYVGGRYHAIQNEDMFSFADSLLGENAQWETAGSLFGGKQVFGSLAINREFVLDPQGANDVTETYLLAHTSHDGAKPMTAMVTPVRVVCQNTLNVAMKDFKQKFTIRHTRTAMDRVEEARHALNLTHSYMDAFEIEARQLFETAIDTKKFYEIVDTVYPRPKVDAGVKASNLTLWENKRDDIATLYFSSPTNATVKGTAWGALQALTEYHDYYRLERDKTGDARFAAASGLTADSGKIKTEMKNIIKALV